jgi:CHASE3 domain sensor protein
LTLKNKTNIAFFAALITLGIIGWFSLQGNRNADEKDHLVSHARDILEASELLRSHIYGAAAARRAYTLWGNSTQIDAFNLASKAALADFATLHKLKADATEEESSSLTQMEALMKARLSLLKASVEMHQKTGDDRKQQDAVDNQSTKLSTQFTELLDVFDRSQRDLLQQQLPAGHKDKCISGYFRFFILDAYAWASQP